MTVRQSKYDFSDTALHNATFMHTAAGEPDQSGLSPQHSVLDTPNPTVKSDVEERQAVEVRPMRYVLGLGILFAIAAMAIVWVSMR
jgi:hypothetical protein